MHPDKTWSPLQQTIFETNARKESIIIEAVAGSGKTTTVVELARRTKACRALAIAFNKRIATELSERLPPHFDCKTMNALGHGIWQRVCGKRLKLDSNKLWKIANSIKVPESIIGDAIALARVARTAGIIPGDDTRALTYSDMETMEELAFTYDLDISRDLRIYALEILEASIKAAHQGEIDFDDQIYMSTLFTNAWPTYDMIMIDEVQDLSALQHKMVTKLCHSKTRIIAVGDSRQAIYGFRGAHANSMKVFERKFNLTPYPLTVSYRCPKAVIHEAQKVVPHIESAQDAPEGYLDWLGPAQPQDLKPGSVVLCRNTAPLVSLAWRCIKQGVSINFLGRDIAKGLVRVINKLAPEAISIELFLDNLSTFTNNEIAKKPRREAKLREQQDVLRVLTLDCETTADILRKIKTIFENDSGQVTLSTIHRSKGFEWDTVYILDRELIPSKYATQPWQLTQEDNLFYVAVTRSQNELFYIDSGDF
jgi:DNA helicase-2/ATP-dependent DNA helicase PcrA